MHIIHYPHPTLRHKSKPLRRVDADLHRIVREMFDLMHEAEGIGLAANQVDLPWRLFVAEAKSERDAAGEEIVFINPVLSRMVDNRFHSHNGRDFRALDEGDHAFGISVFFETANLYFWRFQNYFKTSFCRGIIRPVSSPHRGIFEEPADITL